MFLLGIVTGNNKKYIDTEKREDNEVILKGSDLYKYKFHPTSNYIVFQPELFQQVAEYSSSVVEKEKHSASMILFVWMVNSFFPLLTVSPIVEHGVRVNII